MTTLEIKETIPAFIVWRNSDLTEGRGYNYPIYACRKESTARRLAEGIDVQGTDGRIEAMNLYRIDGFVYGPTIVAQPSKEDDKEQDRLDSLKRVREKAKLAGLTEEEITILSSLR